MGKIVKYCKPEHNVFCGSRTLLLSPTIFDPTYSTLFDPGNEDISLKESFSSKQDLT